MIGRVINLERLDENSNVVSTTPLYASKDYNKLLRKLEQIKNEWENDIYAHNLDDVDIMDYGDQIVIVGDYGDDDCNKSRYIIEYIEIL